MEYICVYSGSSDKGPENHKQAARDLGKAIVEAGYGLIYGGAKVGLMGIIANSVLEAGGQVKGVITPEVEALEVVHQGLQTLIKAENYQQRKRLMMEGSVACIALPGGLGTLDESFESLIKNQFASYKNTDDNPVKPFCLVNTDGFYEHQIKQLDICVEHGYMKQSHRDMVYASGNIANILAHIKGYKKPAADAGKWWEQTNAKPITPLLDKNIPRVAAGSNIAISDEDIQHLPPKWRFKVEGKTNKPTM
tara:strand:+ start:22218 stop:22967 length:750 start_codon:yes stop_codon:yes gene_type:complete